MLNKLTEVQIQQNEGWNCNIQYMVIDRNSQASSASKKGKDGEDIMKGWQGKENDKTGTSKTVE